MKRRSDLPPVLINGKFITQRLTGVQRYAFEIVKALGKIAEAGTYALIVPKSAEMPACADFGSVEMIRYGDRAGTLWEQIDLAELRRKTNAELINLCNTAPFSCPGIVCVHDMLIRRMPEIYTRKFVIWYNFLYSMYARKAKWILTVSEFSKNEIELLYPAMKDRIEVIPNGWEHIEEVSNDEEVIDKLPEECVKKGYYLTIASMSKNKNYEWILKTAEKNQNEYFVIAGGDSKKTFAKQKQYSQLPNVIRLGYISDGELKSLMIKCKAFLFPSLYEGFGIPPLEALACGAELILSNIPVFQEIYGNCARYIDNTLPCDLSFGIEMRSNASGSTKARRDSILNKYSWTKSAHKLDELVKMRVLHCL